MAGSIANLRHGYSSDAIARAGLRLLALAAALMLAACEGGRSGDIFSPRGSRISSAPPAARPAPAPAPAPAPQVAALPPPAVTPAPAGPVRIAVLVPLSGEAAAVGLALRDAALLAQFEIADPGLILQVYDTAGTAEGARAAAESARAQGAGLFVGPLFSQSVQAVAPVAEGAGIPVLSFSSDPQARAPGVYVTGFLIRPQVARVVSYAVEQGRRRLAVLAPDTPYGRAAADAAREAVEKAGGSLARLVFFDPARANNSALVSELTGYAGRKAAMDKERAELAKSDDPAAESALKRLENQETLGQPDFDALLLPMDGTVLRQMLSLLRFYDVDPGAVKFLGTLLWQDDSLAAEATLEGAWYPSASRVGFARFVSRFRETYGREPSQLASLAYDATALAAALARQGGGWKSLTSENGFIGVNGAFRLDPDGTAERALAVSEISRAGARVVSPAPTRFSRTATAP